MPRIYTLRNSTLKTKRLALWKDKDHMTARLAAERGFERVPPLFWMRYIPLILLARCVCVVAAKSRRCQRRESPTSIISARGDWAGQHQGESEREREDDNDPKRFGPRAHTASVHSNLNVTMLRFGPGKTRYHLSERARERPFSHSLLLYVHTTRCCAACCWGEEERRFNATLAQKRQYKGHKERELLLNVVYFI